MKHFATPHFWACYRALPSSVQKVADEKYALLKSDPQHPSLHFTRVGRFSSVRIGLHYRALGVTTPAGVVWFWVGSHAECDQLVG